MSVIYKALRNIRVGGRNGDPERAPAATGTTKGRLHHINRYLLTPGGVLLIALASGAAVALAHTLLGVLTRPPADTTLQGVAFAPRVAEDPTEATDTTPSSGDPAELATLEVPPAPSEEAQDLDAQSSPTAQSLPRAGSSNTPPGSGVESKTAAADTSGFDLDSTAFQPADPTARAPAVDEPPAKPVRLLPGQVPRAEPIRAPRLLAPAATPVAEAPNSKPYEQTLFDDPGVYSDSAPVFVDSSYPGSSAESFPGVDPRHTLPASLSKEPFGAEDELGEPTALVHVTRQSEGALLVARLQRAMRSGNDAAVLEQLQQLADFKGETNRYVLMMRAYWHMRSREYGLAEALLQEVLGRDSADLEAGVNLAIIEMHTGRGASAYERLKQMLDIYPEDPRVNQLIEHARTLAG